MRIFKSLIIAATAATLSTQATAGGFATTVVEPIVVIPEPAPVRRSSLGVILPLAILAILVGVAVSRDDDDDDDEEEEEEILR